MKTKEELNAPKEDVEIAEKKLTELPGDELEQVSGGLKQNIHPFYKPENWRWIEDYHA